MVKYTIVSETDENGNLTSRDENDASYPLTLYNPELRYV